MFKFLPVMSNIKGNQYTKFHQNTMSRKLTRIIFIKNLLLWTFEISSNEQIDNIGNGNI